jgi:hypothetical protein
MTDDVQEKVVHEQATRLNDVATDERVHAVLGGLRERFGQEVAQAVTDLQALGLEDDDIDSLVEAELIVASKYKRVPDQPVEAEFRE